MSAERRGWRIPSPSSAVPLSLNQAFIVNGILAAVYFVAARAGLKLAFVNASATAVWPRTGIALAALLLFGFRAWPGIFLGAFLANLTTAGTVATSLAIAGGGTLWKAWSGPTLSTRSPTAGTRFAARPTSFGSRSLRRS
ncbi:MAG: MASE1 domain-containing protein [Armatimonadota bacterium]